VRLSLRQIVLYAGAVSTETPTRKSVPLTAEEAALIERARQIGTPQHEALVRLVGESATRSEASTMHALISFALTALGEQIAMYDYEQLAASQDAEDEAYKAAIRRRTRDR
jgi:hypothetical protein